MVITWFGSVPSLFNSSDTTPLLSNSTQDRMFETMSVEIEQLLAKVRIL